MEASRPSGIYLYSKERSDIHVLKDLMQLMKSVSLGKSGSFAYVEAQTSLIPHLSLWENLQLEAGGGSWQELAQQASAELRQLMNLVVNHDQLAQTAQAWEKFSISLLKGIMMPSPHILLDMNEDLLSPIMIPLLKKILIKASAQKKISRPLP